MAASLVYIETTIASAYYERRKDPGSVERRHWTREWWLQASSSDAELVVSVAVWAEHLRGPEFRQREWQALIRPLRLLHWLPAVQRVADEYVARKLMPGGLSEDALHLAFASYYSCDVLLTWDLDHLANPRKFDHIRHVNGRLGLFVPRIITPRQYLGGSDGE